MTDKYVLDGRTPRRAASLAEWEKWLEKAERHVAQDRVGGVFVSTVFLGVDHSWTRPPLLFETMIFNGPHDGYQTRCTTWTQAEKMHADALALVSPGRPAVTDRYRRVYETLKRVGHSPATALRILLDAKRGDRAARGWIRTVRAAWRQS